MEHQMEHQMESGFRQGFIGIKGYGNPTSKVLLMVAGSHFAELGLPKSFFRSGTPYSPCVGSMLEWGRAPERHVSRRLSKLLWG